MAFAHRLGREARKRLITADGRGLPDRRARRLASADRWPAGAFIVIVYGIVERTAALPHGRWPAYDVFVTGLFTPRRAGDATSRCSIVIGFTNGIAVLDRAVAGERPVRAGD
ncbi:MAG: hypothetical protein QM702_26440 [Rubrivivax sp.]